MDGVCEEQQQKFQSAHQLYLSTKKSFRDLDIPQRKLLTRRLAALSSEPSMEMYHQIPHQQNESPHVLPEETLFEKFLPNSSIDDASDPYSSDEFRMYEFKIRKCTRSRSHDWTECPFAHPGEKARRRCTRRFNYSGVVCSEFRRGSCVRGDSCEFAHGVFECWLHPSRYRTEACKDGKDCQRKICFFAHTPSQLRSTRPETASSPSKNDRRTGGHSSYCRCYSNSPTSILDMDQMSPPSSPPPFSPAQPGGGLSPISRFCDRLVRAESYGSSQLGHDSKKGLMSPREIEELMGSMKGMNMSSIDDQGPNLNPKWTNSFKCNDDQQTIFSFCPSARGSSRVLPEDCSGSSTSSPDLEWVNDLLT